jgi:hypothetical protein
LTSCARVRCNHAAARALRTRSLDRLRSELINRMRATLRDQSLQHWRMHSEHVRTLQAERAAMVRDVECLSAAAVFDLRCTQAEARLLCYPLLRRARGAKWRMVRICNSIAGQCCLTAYGGAGPT